MFLDASHPTFPAQSSGTAFTTGLQKVASSLHVREQSSENGSCLKTSSGQPKDLEVGFCCAGHFRFRSLIVTVKEKEIDCEM